MSPTSDNNVAADLNLWKSGFGRGSANGGGMLCGPVAARQPLFAVSDQL
jgi:hypothetical protein